MSEPHSHLMGDGTAEHPYTRVCWCGVEHDWPEGAHNPITDGPYPEGYWQPMTEELLDGLYTEAWLGEEDRRGRFEDTA